jgi:hypothetical protein
MRLCLVLTDPGRTESIRPWRWFGAAPASGDDKGSLREVISGLNGKTLALAVYASPGGLPTQDARLASGCWPSFTGWDWLPTGF